MAEQGDSDAEGGAHVERAVRRTGRPPASSEHVRKRMESQARRDTALELALRSELWRRGLRYRLQVPIVTKRRRQDIVFPRARVVVDVRGCFWHACPQHGTLPKSNRDWWEAKLRANKRRDSDTESRLRDLGWLPIVVWEHETVKEAADRVAEAVLRRRGGGTERRRTT